MNQKKRHCIHCSYQLKPCLAQFFKWFLGMLVSNGFPWNLFFDRWLPNVEILCRNFILFFLIKGFLKKRMRSSYSDLVYASEHPPPLFSFLSSILISFSIKLSCLLLYKGYFKCIIAFELYQVTIFYVATLNLIVLIFFRSLFNLLIAAVIHHMRTHNLICRFWSWNLIIMTTNHEDLYQPRTLRCLWLLLRTWAI